MQHPNQDRRPKFFSERFEGLLLRESEMRVRQHHNPHSFFLCGIHQDGICCCRSSRLLCFVGDGVPDAAGRLACAVRAASVARVTRVPRVTAAALVFAACFCFFCQSRRVVAALVCALFAVAGSETCAGRRATRLCYYDGDRHGGGR